MKKLMVQSINVKVNKDASKIIFATLSKYENQFKDSVPKKYFERVELVREFAEACRTNNVGNRKSNKKMREKIANAMRSKDGWVYNGAAIRITKSGRLVDGQNRILAFLDADCPKGILLDVIVTDDITVEVRDTLGVCIPYSNYQFTVDNGFSADIAKRVETIAVSLMSMATRPHDGKINKLHPKCLKDTEDYYRKELTEFCTETNAKGVYNPTAATLIFIGKVSGRWDEFRKLLVDASAASMSPDKADKVPHLASVRGDWTRGYRQFHSKKTGKVASGNGTYDTQVKMAVGIMTGLALLNNNRSFRLSIDGKYENNLGELLNKARSLVGEYGIDGFVPEVLNALATDKFGD